jgi:membrane protein implicated in regulation of membrane protease activity
MTPELFSNGWVWLATALALGVLEVLAPGFVFLGFALGALVIGVLLLTTGVALSAPMLALIFAGLSLIAWLVMRRIFGRNTSQVQTFDHDVND